MDLRDCGLRLPGVLALPMLDHSALAGFVLLGLSSSCADYRPDEIELLSWGAHKVGLDLQALQVKAVEAANKAVKAENAVLAAKLDDLRAQNDRLNELFERAVVRGA